MRHTLQHTGRIRLSHSMVVAFVIAMLVAASVVPISGSSQEAATVHPLVGTWVVDPEVSQPSNPPSFNAFMADGTMVNIGSDGASVGSWEATGPRTASMTFSGLVAGEQGVVFIIRGDLEVDESGNALTGAHSFTMVAADGTVLMAAEGDGAAGTRIHAEPASSGGQGLEGFPTWMPATPAS